MTKTQGFPGGLLLPGILTTTELIHSDEDREPCQGFPPTELIRDDEEPGFPTMTELIHSTNEDGELSVLTCKAVTRETSPLPGVFDADLIHNDEEQESAFGFYMQSNNIGDLTGFRCRADSQ